MKRQIKTKLLRILCIALILCMMLALIPAAFATTAENFTIDMVNDVENATKATYDTTKNNRWAYGTTNTTVLDGDAPYGLKVSSNDVKQYVTIEFKAPATGNYKVTYDYVLYSNGAIGNVYVVPFTEDISDVISGDNGKIISNVYYNINYNNSKNGDTASKTSEEYVSLVENERYLVVFVVSEWYEVSGVPKYRMYPSVLTFTKQSEPGITINYNIKDIITAKQQANFGDGGVAFSDLFNYEETKGFFDFVTASRENTGESSSFCCYRNFIQFADDSESHIVFELNVPVKGEYSIKVDTRKNFTAPVRVFLSQDTTDYMDEGFLIGTYAGIADSESTVDVLTEEETVWKKELAAGKYYIAFTGKESDGAKGSLGNLYLYTGGGEGESPVYMGALLKADKTVMNVDDIASLEVIAYMSDGNPADTAVEWESDNEDVATVNNGKVTAISSGVANISAVVTYNDVKETITKSITVNDAELLSAFSDGVTKTENSEAVGAEATINILTYSTDGEKLFDGEVAEVKKVPFGTQASITAPEAPSGYTFLYWAKGATDSKQIIPGKTCTIYPTVEQTNLIAVYEPISGTTGNKVEFYNYNGQLLDCKITEAGKMPELPYMTGYGKADHWAHYGSDVTYGEGDPALEISGTEIFVAQYNDLKENITVTAENCTVNGKESATVKYGDTVTCVATGVEGKTFKWWTKTDENDNTEIVSLDEKYTFKAWETCTVTAVYGDKAPTYVGDTMRIIIDKLIVEGTTDEAVMAEFVGLDSAIEKGIMLGTKKIAMSSKDNQFTIINDDNATEIKGYAILANGTLITDN